LLERGLDESSGAEVPGTDFKNQRGGTRSKKLLENGRLGEWRIREHVARRYGYKPFDPELTEDLTNPYRRAVLLASLDIKTEQQIIAEFLIQHFPDLLVGVLDVVGTANVNVHLPKGKTIKNLFERKKKQEKRGSKIYKVPDGKGGYMDVEVY
jgi:hypothetical protein